MDEPVLSPSFTVEDIHKLREYNHEKTKDLTPEERQRYYNDAGMEVHETLQKKKKIFWSSAYDHSIHFLTKRKSQL